MIGKTSLQERRFGLFLLCGEGFKGGGGVGVSERIPPCSAGQDKFGRYTLTSLKNYEQSSLCMGDTHA